MFIAGVFCVAVGVLIVAQWAITLVKRQVPSLESKQGGSRGKVEMGFHLAAEFATAILLIISGSALLNQDAWSINAFLIALGMLIYTLINSPGYFAQMRKWPMVVLFCVLLLLAILSLIAVIVDINTLIY
jgi:hypothetical protein